MGLREGLRTFLLADAQIAAVVAGRVYPVTMPQGNRLACIVYSRIANAGDHTMQGSSGLARPRYQVDAWAPDPDTADQLANLIKVRLDGYRGLMGETAPVQGCFFRAERDDFDPDVQMYRCSRDYEIWWEER